MSEFVKHSSYCTAREGWSSRTESCGIICCFCWWSECLLIGVIVPTIWWSLNYWICTPLALGSPVDSWVELKYFKYLLWFW